MLALAWLASCRAASPQPASSPLTQPAQPAPAAAAALEAHPTAPETAHPDPAPPATAPEPSPARPAWLDIDWATVSIKDNAAALALWQRIAPTGADWENVYKIPPTAARPLAVALLRGGNLVCHPRRASTPAPPCASGPVDDEAVIDLVLGRPSDTAGFGDPCLRERLALWAFEQLTPADVPAVKAALLQIAATPPPEDESPHETRLRSAALRLIPASDQDTLLAFLVAVRRGRPLLGEAGHNRLYELDERHRIAAVRNHIVEALGLLDPEKHRSVLVAGIADPAMDPDKRIDILTRLVDGPGLSLQYSLGEALPPHLTAILAAAARAKDCAVAGTAAKHLDNQGDHRFVPRRLRSHDVTALMHALCVAATYQDTPPRPDDPLLTSYLPARGLELVRLTEAAREDFPVDDPTNTSATVLVPRDKATELIAVAIYSGHCKGTRCTSDFHDFRFVWTRSGADTVLSRLEIGAPPRCP